MSNIQFVVLAAGSGQRFKEAGYEISKPMIYSRGEPMIVRPLRLALNHGPDRAPVVVCNWQDVVAINNVPIPHICCQLEYVQHGPALSLLCAGGMLADEDPVVVLACDDVIDHIAFANFIKAFQNDCQKKTGRASAFVLTTVLSLEEDGGKLARWAYVKGSSQNVSYIKEKVRVNSLNEEQRVFCGALAFRSWYVARLAVMRMICASEDSVQGEFYLAPCVNYMGYVRYFDIPRAAFATVGTPEELQAYEAQNG